MTRKQQMDKAIISIINAIDVIERVDHRCMAVDGPVSETVDEIRPEEMRDIWKFLNQAKNNLSSRSPE